MSRKLNARIEKLEKTLPETTPAQNAKDELIAWIETATPDQLCTADDLITKIIDGKPAEAMARWHELNRLGAPHNSLEAWQRTITDGFSETST